MADNKPKLFLFAVIQVKPEYFSAAKAALDPKSTCCTY